MKADAAAKRDDVKAKIDKRNREMDAKAAAKEADWAEDDAAAALDYAAWTLSDARLAVLDAIYARSYADERAKTRQANEARRRTRGSRPGAADRNRAFDDERDT